MMTLTTIREVARRTRLRLEGVHPREKASMGLEEAFVKRPNRIGIAGDATFVRVHPEEPRRRYVVTNDNARQSGSYEYGIQVARGMNIYLVRNLNIFIITVYI